MPDPLDESAFRFEITCDTPGNLSVVIKCELLVFDDIRDRANQQQATSKEVQKTDTYFAQREAMEAWNTGDSNCCH